MKSWKNGTKKSMKRWFCRMCVRMWLNVRNSAGNRLPLQKNWKNYTKNGRSLRKRKLLFIQSCLFFVCKLIEGLQIISLTYKVSMNLFRLNFPHPWIFLLYPKSSAPRSRRRFISTFESAGSFSSINAQAPEMTGVDIEVPLFIP